MTQDQCLDNGHQGASSSHSTYDKTNDDPNKSNNSTLKSGINRAQEFNVDVNSKRIDQQSADVVVVKNVGIDTDRSSTDKVLTATDNYFGNSIENIANEKEKHLTTNMTVITHQSSDENIRDIISHSDDLNKIPNDSQINVEENLINEQSDNNSNSIRKRTVRSKSDVSNSENDNPDDPIERLNKLRASISSALSEVKGVLKQYSIEQNVDNEPETSMSSKPVNDGPVKFRFVRKIRRRSIFSEDNEDISAQNCIPREGVTVDTSSTCKPVVLSTNVTAINDSVCVNDSSLVKTEKINPSNEKTIDSKDTKSINIDGNAMTVSRIDNRDETKDVLQIVSERDINEACFSKTENCETILKSENYNTHISNDVVSKKQKVVNNNINLTKNEKKPESTPAKMAKVKKVIKQDRRASVSSENISSEVILKTQRRPSDSGTIVKTPKPKIFENTKSSVQKISNSNKKADIFVIKNTSPIQSPQAQKMDTTSNNSNTNSTGETLAIKPDNETKIEANIQIIKTNNETKKMSAILDLEATNPEESSNEISEDPKQENGKCVTILNSSMDSQSIEIINDVKSNVKQDVTTVENNDSNSSVSVQQNAEGSEHDIVLEEETKHAIKTTLNKQKKNSKRKVVIRRIKRKLSKDDTFIQVQEAPSELEIEEKEIDEQFANEDVPVDEEIAPKPLKPCIKARQFEVGDIVMYAERYKKTQVKWRKAKIIERITSISYKLDIEGEEKPAHISYIKKFTERKVNFGGKEYLEIDYAQIEEDEEKERNYSIWNLA